MKYAFPSDELAPLTCSGRGPDWYNPANYATNDVAGNFSVTLIDSIDTLVILNDKPAFEQAVRDIMHWVSFDVNTKPQVFETNIRVLGGLLSAHLLASKPDQPFHLPWYRSELLSLARDLGERLLPAFKTQTGIPYARINLRHGVPKGESIETCTAGAGSLILEFGTLSRLTGDDRFEKAAYKAFFALWNQRSDIGLVGNTINTWNGAWLHPEVSSIGAGVDSFYEYALKWYILSGEVEFLDVFQEAYASAMRYIRAPDGFWYRSANMFTGDPVYNTLDSLSAFWPGLQVLAGDVENAIQSHMIYWNIWKKFSGLPEVWDMNFRMATALQYPLRPEFIESTWYLYRATRDPFYLDVGERILHDIITRAKVECGLTGISDLRTNVRDDRMESFVLSETLKYLYLLFDEENPIHSDDSNFVLTTEGHLLTMSRDLQKPLSPIRRQLRRVEHLQCPAYQSPVMVYSPHGENALTAGIYFRRDVDYARSLIAAPSTEEEQQTWSPGGWCAIPKVDLYTFEFILSPNGQNVLEDHHPTADKLKPVSDGYLLQNVSGVRARVVSRLDGKGYDVTKLGPFSVKTGQIVYVNDSSLMLAPFNGKMPIDSTGPRHRVPEIDLKLFIDFFDPLLVFQSGMHDIVTEAFVRAFTSTFAGDPVVRGHSIRFGHGEGVRLVRDDSNPFGCNPYEHEFGGDAIVVLRGECTFLEKLMRAAAADASGVIAISDEDYGVNPSGDNEELQTVKDSLDDVAIVVVDRQDGEVLTAMMDSADMHGGQVVMIIPPIDAVPDSRDSGHPTDDQRTKAREAHNVLYLNGHPLLNTRLLV
ncbi:hypothetical protein NM688_g94 [Phlebia brevispora]|uniref:Uncharacterized protein n=1 Tax=Phlebia brevispora TaxID=194682 RepID=A0ACC1TFA4_9APHY|nr:hypothetical protein NM688_g94 [Phlebia brevispora]